jgi:RNA polymerase sigma-70 factor (ECF subfamily)
MDIVKRFEQTPDAEIIAEILQGRTHLFEVLIRRNNPFLYKAGRSYGYPHEDVQDLMQETFVSAYQHLRDFGHRSSFRTWIVRIMLNHCYQKAQRYAHKNETTASEISEKAIPMFSQPSADTDKIVIGHEMRQALEHALLSIPLEYRVVFSLREVNGMNTIETAEALSISEANVKVRLNRAKKMLREQIEKSYAPGDLFDFNLVYCDAIVNRVFEELGIVKEVKI